MPARTGQQFIEAVNSTVRDVVIHGQRIRSRIGEHPAFRNMVRNYAHLYDMQHDPKYRDILTYVSPTTGDRVGISFLQPRTKEELHQRTVMMKTWLDWSCGMFGRTADYLNSALMAMAAAADWFGQVDRGFADNIRRYYEYVRENDLLLTHTLINPQANRSKSAAQQKDPFLAARIVRQTDAGIIVRGARMLATVGPIADEILVFPSTLLKVGPEEEPYSYAFAIPSDTPGLRYICRESFDYGRTHFDHPLGSRFDENDAIAVFDDVLVPYERCFMIGHPELLSAGRLHTETGAIVHMSHQVVVKALAKTEFFLGLISLITDAIQIEQYQHVQEKIAEVIIALETVKGLLTAAEAEASLSPWGLMSPAWEPLNVCRNWYPRMYPRLAQIVWQLGASGLFALPTEADAYGPAQEEIDSYLSCATLDGIERLKLFRLAWDASLSAFAGRQVAYEYFFFGDPVRMAGALVNSYDRKPYMDKVKRLLERED